MYSVYADDNREYRSSRARSVASVAAAWRRQGLNPVAWTVIENADGQIETREAKITTVAATAKALASNR